jgi:hypothetical protein
MTSSRLELETIRACSLACSKFSAQILLLISQMEQADTQYEVLHIVRSLKLPSVNERLS